MPLSDVAEEVGFAAVPGGPRGRPAVASGGLVFAILRQAAQPKAAMRLLRDVVAPELVARVARETGRIRRGARRSSSPRPACRSSRRRRPCCSTPSRVRRTARSARLGAAAGDARGGAHGSAHADAGCTPRSGARRGDHGPAARRGWSRGEATGCTVVRSVVTLGAGAREERQMAIPQRIGRVTRLYVTRSSENEGVTFRPSRHSYRGATEGWLFPAEPKASELQRFVFVGPVAAINGYQLRIRTESDITSDEFAVVRYMTVDW